MGGIAMTDEDIDSGVLFGTLRGTVVGLRYYAGVVNNNEMVALQREPNNRYDMNAIKVNNVNGEQVGHIKKELAACLAYIMDSKLALIEGVVPFGANNAFTMPVQLSFWGKPENKDVVLKHLNVYNFKLAPPGKSLGLGFGYSGTSGRAGTSYSAPGHAAVQMTTEQLKTEFDKLFEDLKEDDKTCEMEAAEAVLTSLLPHQKQALAWMISRENNKELPPFWEEREDYFYNTITNFAEKKRPGNVLGGILADDMGLGKTLTTIAVILTNFHGGKPLPLEKKSDQLNEKCVSTVKTDFKAPSASDTKEENDSVPSQSSHPKRGGEKKPTYTISSDSEPDEKITQKANTKAQKILPGSSKRRKASSVSDMKEENVLPQSSCPKRSRGRGKKPTYTDSNDSESEEKINKKANVEAKKTQQGARKRKGASCDMEDNAFASALGKPAVSSKKAKKKGGTAVQSNNTETEENLRATLIVCPLSVLSNWTDQLEQHIDPAVHLNTYVYYGSERSKDPAILSRQDIVLTTYSVLSSDYS
ncbi:UNVERIFIED_CONTAM: hypothetical protein K2H54_057208, partial [Gekko kuhli]